MPHFYLQRNDGTISDSAEYAQEPEQRAEGVWVEGAPSTEAQVFEPKPLKDSLKALFISLPIAQQVALGQVSAAVLMFLENGNPAAAKATIKAATVPQELEDLRTQLLSVFGDAD